MSKKTSSAGKSQKPAPRFARDYAASRFRMQRLHELLSAKELVTVKRLHEEFGVSERTIKEDIHRMRDEHGAPITWVQRENSYVYERPFTDLPLLRLTGREAMVLALHTQRYAAARSSPVARSYLALIRKIGPLVASDTSYAIDALRDVLVQTDEIAETEERYLLALHDEVAARREVELNYERPGEAARVRTVRPLHLALVDHRWLMFGRDVREPDVNRTYLLARVRGLKATGRRFTRPADFCAADVLRDSLRRYTGTESHEVRIAYDKLGAAYAREALPPHKRNFTERSDGRMELALRVNNLVDIEKEVLRAGEHAEVLAPAALRRRVRDVLRAALKQYEDDGDGESEGGR